MSAPRQVGKWSGTFQWWDQYPPGEVREVAKEELGDYESNYVHCFNYIKDKGWTYKKPWWISPCGNLKIESCYQAYTTQKCREGRGI